MAIEFVVEDGTGKADATSYVTLAEFEQYWENRGVDYTGTADDTKKAWLNTTTEFFDTYFRFYGYSTNYETQALQFPREKIRDNKGNLLANNVVPTELKNAVCRLAPEVNNNTDLTAKIDTGETSKRVGPVSITYRSGYKKEYNQVVNMIRHLIKNKAALVTVT